MYNFSMHDVIANGVMSPVVTQIEEPQQDPKVMDYFLSPTSDDYQVRVDAWN